LENTMPRSIPTRPTPAWRRLPFVLGSLAIGTLLLGLSVSARAQADDTLYRAWGGEAGIRAVMQDFVPRLVAHPRIGHFFQGTNREHLTKQLTAQLCQVAGGPCVYEGADMKAAHRDMGVGRGDFNALVEALQQSMEAQRIPFGAQTAMLARLAPMHRDIVEP
jgi:hemoglobin